MSTPMRKNNFVVTTRIGRRAGDSAQTQVWESSHPLALGHPFRWVLERTETGVRLRDLTCETEKVLTDGVHELTHQQLDNGAEIAVAPYFLKIHSVREIAPAFESSTPGSTLMVYQCLDRWLVESRRAEDSYSPRLHSKTPFTLKKSANGYTFKANAEGVRLNGSQDRTFKAGETIEISTTDLARSTLRFKPQGSESALLWRFGLVEAPAFIDAVRKQKTAIELEDATWFKKAIRATAVGFATLIVLSYLWPQQKEDPKVLIPEQFTKIVMAPQPKKAAPAAASESGAPAAAQNAPKKVQDAAVVQAFRAKALTNAVNGLLKGGMTKLLAQSDFVAGTNHSNEARKLFDSKSDALKTSAPLGGIGDKSVEVANIGGGTAAGGSNVGYGKGEHAGVKGQGKGFTPFVSADASGSVVDEGLTKDEVGEVIHKHLSEVRYCYESAMIRTPDIEGKLMTNFTINGQGIIKSAEVKSSTLPDPRLDDCIVRRLATWQFPKPRGGVDVSVTYPFIFKTLGR